MDGTITTLLRPALELACAVAREGERLRPPVAPPGPMRPLVRFARLGDRALDTVRRVVDEDEAFRASVAAAADEQRLGRIPWLWLVRPDGWSDEIASAAAALEAQSQDKDDRRADRGARRRLALVEASLLRSETDLDESQKVAAALAAELNTLRQDRRAEIAAATRDRAALAAAGEARDDAERRAVAAESRHAELEDRLVAAEDRWRCSETLNRQLTAALDAARRDLAAAERAREADAARTVSASSALGRAVGDAADAAGRLGVALGEAARLLGDRPGGGAGGSGDPAATRGGAAPADQEPAGPDPVGPVTATAPGASPPVDGAAANRGPGPEAPGSPPRRAVPLPGAVFDDSADAAAWLVRVPGVILIVDGYNVTLAAWPGRELPDQRHRLVSALAELSMRTGVEVEVVFDGADDHRAPIRSMPARRPVRVLFSPPEVDADEIIIERVAQLPAARPVIVATNDRRVRDECARAGANLLSTEQLVTVLGRSAGPGRP